MSGIWIKNATVETAPQVSMVIVSIMVVFDIPKLITANAIRARMAPQMMIKFVLCIFLTDIYSPYNMKTIEKKFASETVNYNPGFQIGQVELWRLDLSGVSPAFCVLRAPFRRDIRRQKI
jgi:hypothetical protein